MSLSLFNIEGEHPRSARAILRRFGLWSLICWISGGPSFAFAVMARHGPMKPNMMLVGDFDPWAMALGIVLFSIGYTIFTSSDAFDQFQRRPGIRPTLYIGYFTRLGVSIVFPLGMALDFVPGIISVRIADGLVSGNRFGHTLLATCIQGAFLNVVLNLHMLVVYAFIQGSAKRRKPQGFEVIVPTGQAVEPVQMAASDNEVPRESR